jgi:hypothetical protein
MLIFRKTKELKNMVKFRTLKFMTRTFTPRNWRCHKRRVFFEELFEELKEVKDKGENHVSGFIQFNANSYTDACHKMAGDISFYPFEKRCFIYIEEFFGEYLPQPLYNELRVNIIRKSPLWRVFIKYGEYEVNVTGTDYRGISIDFKYTKKMKLP